MRATAFGRLVRFTVGALLALLACDLSRPSIARAGCSHPADPSAVESAHFEQLARLGALATRPGDPPTGPARPAPCSGPTCSKAPAVPLAPVQAPPHRGAPEAILDPADLAPDLGSAPTAPADPILRPAHADPAIFHPPRPAPSLPSL